MSILLSLMNYPDVKSAVVCDSSGALLEALGDIDAENIAGVMGFFASNLSLAGEALQLGAMSRAMLVDKACVLVRRADTLVVVYVNPACAKDNIDKIVANIEWEKAGDSTPLLQPREELAEGQKTQSAARGAAPTATTAAKKAVPAGQPLDPTDFEKLRTQLAEVHHDKQAVRGVFSRDPALPQRWLQSSYGQLRHDLAEGNLPGAESLGELVGAVLESMEDGSTDELADSYLHREFMNWLLDGVGAVQSGDNLTGISVLDNISEKVFANDSLRWVATHWIARAAAGAGELDRGKKAAGLAIELAEKLDPYAQSCSLATLAEIELISGETESALAHIASARNLFFRLGDKANLAKGWLVEARILLAAGRSREAVHAAQRAHDTSPAWPDPIIFLSRQAVRDDKIWKAESLLSELARTEPVHPDIARENKLVEQIRKGNVPFMVANDYIRLHESLPSDEVVERLNGLMESCPGFLQLRETLAWKLLKLGKYDDAFGHFNALYEQQLDPELVSSVLLGLGCISMAQQRHRQPEARIRAVVAPSPAAIRQQMAQKQLQKPEAAAKGPGAAADGAAPGGKSLSPTSSAVFTGEIHLFAVPDLLEFLKSSHRTGALVISAESGVGAIYLRKGMVVGAASPACMNIGDILLSSGKISPGQLKKTVELQEKDPNRLLGAIMVEHGIVQPDMMRDALTAQVYSAVREMIGWTTGRFVFEPDKTGNTMPSECGIELDTQSVLLDIFRQMDEENRDESEQ
jgi:tetratricopeptide (TPR) repeat protein